MNEVIIRLANKRHGNYSEVLVNETPIISRNSIESKNMGGINMIYFKSGLKSYEFYNFGFFGKNRNMVWNSFINIVKSIPHDKFIIFTIKSDIIKYLNTPAKNYIVNEIGCAKFRNIHNAGSWATILYKKKQGEYIVLSELLDNKGHLELIEQLPDNIHDYNMQIEESLLNLNQNISKNNVSQTKELLDKEIDELDKDMKKLNKKMHLLNIKLQSLKILKEQKIKLLKSGISPIIIPGSENQDIFGGIEPDIDVLMKNMLEGEGKGTGLDQGKGTGKGTGLDQGKGTGKGTGLDQGLDQGLGKGQNIVWDNVFGHNIIERPKSPDSPKSPVAITG